MYRVSREGQHWKAVGTDAAAGGPSPLEALRALKRRELNVLERTRRWVLYVASQERAVDRFGEAVSKAGGQWKPVAVQPAKLDAAVKAIEPEMIVVAINEPGGDPLLHQAMARHGQRRVVIDDRQLTAVSKLLSAAPVVP